MAEGGSLDGFRNARWRGPVGKSRFTGATALIIAFSLESRGDLLHLPLPSRVRLRGITGLPLRPAHLYLNPDESAPLGSRSGGLPHIGSRPASTVSHEAQRWGDAARHVHQSLRCVVLDEECTCGPAALNCGDRGQEENGASDYEGTLGAWGVNQCRGLLRSSDNEAQCSRHPTESRRAMPKRTDARHLTANACKSRTRGLVSPQAQPPELSALSLHALLFLDPEARIISESLQHPLDAHEAE